MAHCDIPLTNFMGQAGIGSFAPVGERLTHFPKAGGARRYLAVELGEACQLKCKHCIYHRTKSLSPRPNEDRLAELYQATHSHFKPQWITIAGKEPTIYRKQLVAAATNLYRSSSVNILMTNGLLLDDELIDLLKGKIDLFDISLDGTREAHDWMRGEGTYDRSWNRIEAVLERTESRVGIIATAVRGEVQPGRQQFAELTGLAQEIVARCGDSGRVVLTLSLYFGPPDDPMLLHAEDIACMIRQLYASGCPSRVLFTANYAHQWPEVARILGLADRVLQYDEGTGLPVIKFGPVNLILFNLTEVPQISSRVSNDGLVFLGCNHLTLGEEAIEHAIGDMGSEPLADILERLVTGTHEVYDHFRNTPEECTECPVYLDCRAGDRLSGLLFDGRAIDPYCERILSS